MIYSGRIIEVTTAMDGSPMYTVANSAGAIFAPCFPLSAASGIKGVKVIAPLELNASVCLIRVDDSNTCFIIGGFSHEDDLTPISVTEPVTADSNEDYRNHHCDEYVAKVGDSSLTLSPRNNLVMDAPSMKLQLQGGKLRVSQENISENEILNADPFLTVLFDYLEKLEQRVVELTSGLNVVIDLVSKHTPAGSPLEQRLTAEIPAEIAVATNAGDLAKVAELQAEALSLTELQPLVGGINTNINTAILNPLGNVATSTKPDAEATKNDHITIP